MKIFKNLRRFLSCLITIKAITKQSAQLLILFFFLLFHDIKEIQY